MKLFNLILTFDSNLVFVVFINLNWEIGKEIKNISTPMGVATYQLRNTLPEEMKAMLPEPEEIVKKLRLFDNKL